MSTNNADGYKTTAAPILEGPRTRTEDDRRPAKGSLPADVAKAVEHVLWYLWGEAQDAFIADEPGACEDHIFRSLVAVDGWFYGHDATAEELVEEWCSDDDRTRARERVRSFRG